MQKHLKLILSFQAVVEETVRPIDFGVIRRRGMMGPLASFNLCRRVEPFTSDSECRLVNARRVSV